MRDKVLKKLEKFVSSVPDNKYSKTIAAISLFDFMDIMRDDDYPIDWFDRLTGSLKNIQDGLLAQEQTILFGDFESQYLKLFFAHLSAIFISLMVCYIIVF